MARQIVLTGHELHYETDRIEFLRPQKVSKYTPDFFITKKDGTKMYIEGKGLFDTRDRQKHLLIKDQYPDLDIRFVFSRADNKIGKTSKTTYAKWCESKGFKYSDKGVIPKEWFYE